MFFVLFSKISARQTQYLATLKLIPQWLALFLLKSGIADLFSSIFRLVYTSTKTVADSLTANLDLQMIFSYIFYGKVIKQPTINKGLTW